MRERTLLELYASSSSILCPSGSLIMQRVLQSDLEGRDIISTALPRLLKTFEIDGTRNPRRTARPPSTERSIGSDTWDALLLFAFKSGIAWRITASCACGMPWRDPYANAGSGREALSTHHGGSHRLVPFGRIGRPDEVAAPVAFLASEVAAFMCRSFVEITGAQAVA